MKNLETIWSKAAALGQTLKEYPRPDMVRRHWINLNGMWDYLITDSRILPWQFYESEYFTKQKSADRGIYLEETDGIRVPAFSGKPVPAAVQYSRFPDRGKLSGK